MKLRIVFWFGLSTILFSCASSKHTDVKDNIFQEFFQGAEIVQITNEGSNYTLSITKNTPDGILKYLVTDEKGKTMIKGVLREGKVEWYSENELKIEETLGIATMSNKGKSVYLLNVSNGTKIEFKQQKQ